MLADTKPQERERGLPEKVGPYRVVSRLGNGDASEVYRGHDDRLDRPVALKRIQPETANRRAAREHFRREARAVARLQHPAIVQIHALVEKDTGDWIVTELVEGRTLGRILRDGPLDAGTVVGLARELAAGLAVAHAAGIVHRNLKPDNVMVDRNGHAKILDFAVTKPQLPEGSSTAPKPAKRQLPDTLTSLSPEQVLGHPVDHRSDLFSLGTLLYEALTGVQPFAGANDEETLTRICTLDPKPIHELDDAIPEILSAVIHHLLHKEPPQRPQSGHEVLQALDSVAVRPAREPASRPSARARDQRPAARADSHGNVPSRPATQASEAGAKTETTRKKATKKTRTKAPEETKAKDTKKTRAKDTEETKAKDTKKTKAKATEETKAKDTEETGREVASPTATPIREPEPHAPAAPAVGFPRPRRWAPIAALAILGLGVAGLALLRWREPPLPSVAVAVPRISGQGPGLTRLTEEALHLGLYRGLLSLQGAGALALETRAVPDETPVQLARATATDEVVTSQLDCHESQCQLTLERVDRAAGSVLWSESVAVPVSDLSLLSRVVEQRLFAAYPGHTPGAGHGEDRDALAALARMELTSGSLENAVELYETLLPKATDSDIHTHLGLAYLFLGDYARAVEQFRRVVDAEPGNLAALVDLADTELLLGETATARRRYERVLLLLDRDPASPGWRSLTLRARTLAHLGQRRPAIAAIEEALDLAPDDPWAAFEAARVYALVDEVPAALVYAERALDRGCQPRWFTLPWFDPLRARGKIGARLEGNGPP